MFNNIPTTISKSSQRIRAVREEADPELEPLIPAEPALNLDAYSRWLEGVLSVTLDKR